MGSSQRVAQVFGIVFLVIAIWGFFVSGGSMESSVTDAPHLMNLFPVNLLHNLVHLLFGVWGLLASRTAVASKNYLIFSGASYLLLMVLGFIVPTFFGLIPIGGNDIWLHALLGIVLLFAGLTAGRALTPDEVL